MVWLTGEAVAGDPAAWLGERLRRPEVLAVPGAHTPLAGVLARRAGFEALYVSGAALSATLALPDLGVMTSDELLFFTRRIARASGLPLIVDADTGYGEVLGLVRLVRELEEAGAAAIQIEDQEMPKKCGHLSEKRIVPAALMCARIEAARRARRSMLIVARTDALALEGLDGAIARARAYVQAGADVVFPEALEGAEQFRRFREALDVPLLANMTEFGRTPHLTLRELEALGVGLAIFPVTALRLAARAMEEGYGELARAGTQKGLLERMQTREELYEAIRYFDYERLDSSIAESALPPGKEPDP